MSNADVMLTVPRLVNAWEPNPNSGILYYKLESAIMHFMYDHRPSGIYGGIYVQFGPDLENVPLGASVLDRLTTRHELVCGTISDITDTEVMFTLFKGAYEEPIRANLDTCRIGFSYMVDNVDDPMSPVRVIKPIMYLRPINRRDDHGVTDTIVNGENSSADTIAVDN